MRVNNQIRAKEVRVIATEGQQMGIYPISEALKLAQQEELDLVEVAPQAQPPVCRIMDYGKYKYELKRREHEAKRHQRHLRLKEIKVRPNTNEHDLQIKVRHIKEFLQDGHKTKVMVVFRGRQIAYLDSGYELLKKIIAEVSDLGKVEVKPRRDGRTLVMILGSDRVPQSGTGRRERERKGVVR